MIIDARPLGAVNAPRDESLFVATYKVKPDDMTNRGHDVPGEAPEAGARILRSVTMKPETEPLIDEIHAAVERLARAVDA